jgi:PST family polysaccharide transporter
MTDTKSYAQILKASSIMGGAAGITLLLGMVRIKFAAVLIGTTGVGLIASFSALQGFIGTLAGLGLQSSAVRDIAAAVARDDRAATGRAVLTLRRMCWLTGLVGMAAMMLASPWLSQLTFGHRDYTLDIAALGVIILFGNLSGGQMALIQGMRRIGDMARANIYGAAAGTVAAIGFYAALGLRGIIPTIVAVSAIQLALSFHFARRVPVPEVSLTWRQTFAEARGMVRLGVLIMANGLLGSAVTFITIALLTQQEGVQAVGLYSAAYALSGVFVGFILNAMGADYYPRLTSAAENKNSINDMVNEQAEIGILLAVPGLLATIIFAPFITLTFYSNEFTPAADLLQWFTLGSLGRVISWPLGYIALARNEKKIYIAVETTSQVIHVTLVCLGLHLFGLIGIAMAFATLLLFSTAITLAAAKKMTSFTWTKKNKARILASVLLLCGAMTIDQHLTPSLQLAAEATILISTLAYSLIEIKRRLKSSG